MFCMFIIIFKLIVKDITLWGERERERYTLLVQNLFTDGVCNKKN